MRLLAEIALIAVAAVGVAVCLTLMPAAPSTRRRRTAVAPPVRPEQLVGLERLASTAAERALDAHAYLRPVLAEIASQRLAARGRTLGRMDESAGRQILGDHLWEMVRPNRAFPDDRQGPGVSPQELGAMLDRLERL